MIVNMIVAMSNNRCIGKDNTLPWHLPEDLKHFKNKTMGKPVIMGRKTYESIGKPLPGRTNVVVSRQTRPVGIPTEVIWAGSLDEAFNALRGVPEAWIIGGGEIYSQGLKYASELIVTRVNQEVLGDTYFPEFEATGKWSLLTVDRPHGAEYRFETWVRKY